MIEIIIQGNPTAQQRHRFGYRKGKIHTYDPSSQKKDDFLVLIHNQAPKSPLKGAISLTCKFYCTRPKAHFGTGSNAKKLKTSAPLWVSKRPDIDNYLKLIMDAGNGVLYQDDSQIVKVLMLKSYSIKPRTEITLEELENVK